MITCPPWCQSDDPPEGHAWHYRETETVKLAAGSVDPDEGRGADTVSVTLERTDRWTAQHSVIVTDTPAVIRIDLDRASGTTSRNFWGYATVDQAEELIASLAAHVAMLRAADGVTA